MTGYLNIFEDSNRKMSFLADNMNEFFKKIYDNMGKNKQFN